MSSISKCEEFAAHFSTKIDTIRSNLSHCQTLDFNTHEPLFASGETLENFFLVDAEMLIKVISKLKPTTCVLDPIPTSFFNLDEDLLNIISGFLQTGVFPSSLKTAIVKPLLKRNNLDPSVLSNYRPVLNLTFLSKILEKVVFNQLKDFLNSHDIFEKYQSGFRAKHSTETALTKVVNDLRCNMDMKKLSVLLDLSAAFDTVDHAILLDRLHTLIGLSGTVFNWLKSYLTGREIFISMDKYSSKSYELKCGVPQGSILGPTLFNLYMLPLGDVIRRHGINFHS